MFLKEKEPALSPFWTLSSIEVTRMSLTSMRAYSCAVWCVLMALPSRALRQAQGPGGGFLKVS